MEDELFEFEGVDGDCIEMNYFGVTLKQKIGEYETGSKFPAASINFEKSWLTLYREGESIAGRYILKLQVVKDLLNSDDE